MLTEKEIKFLNFLYKRLKGAHLDYTELKEYIKKNSYGVILHNILFLL